MVNFAKNNYVRNQHFSAKITLRHKAVLTLQPLQDYCQEQCKLLLD